MTPPRVIFIDSFSDGLYAARSKSGKQSIHFEDSEMFGPAALDRKGNPYPIADKSWFWDFYDDWKSNGMPTSGEISTPFGTLQRAEWGPKP